MIGLFLYCGVTLFIYTPCDFCTCLLCMRTLSLCRLDYTRVIFIFQKNYQFFGFPSASSSNLFIKSGKMKQRNYSWSYDITNPCPFPSLLLLSEKKILSTKPCLKNTWQKVEINATRHCQCFISLKFWNHWGRGWVWWLNCVTFTPLGSAGNEIFKCCISCGGTRAIWIPLKSFRRAFRKYLINFSTSFFQKHSGRRARKLKACFSLFRAGPAPAKENKKARCWMGEHISSRHGNAHPDRPWGGTEAQEVKKCSPEIDGRCGWTSSLCQCHC